MFQTQIPTYVPLNYLDEVSVTFREVSQRNPLHRRKQRDSDNYDEINWKYYGSYLNTGTLPCHLIVYHQDVPGRKAADALAQYFVPNDDFIQAILRAFAQCIKSLHAT
jgi:hypothetical protein